MAIRLKYDVAGFGGSITGGGSPSDKKYGQQLVLQQQQIADRQREDAQRLAYGQQNQAMQNQFQLARDKAQQDAAGQLALTNLNAAQKFGAEKNVAIEQRAEQVRMQQAQQQARALEEGDIDAGIKNREWDSDDATKIRNNRIALAKVRARDGYDDKSGPLAETDLMKQRDDLLGRRKKPPAPPTIDEQFNSRLHVRPDGSEWMLNAKNEFVPVVRPKAEPAVMPPPKFAGEAFERDKKERDSYRSRAEAALNDEGTNDDINAKMVELWNSDQKLYKTGGAPVDQQPTATTPATTDGIAAPTATTTPNPNEIVASQSSQPGQASQKPWVPYVDRAVGEEYVDLDGSILLKTPTGALFKGRVPPGTDLPVEAGAAPQNEFMSQTARNVADADAAGRDAERQTQAEQAGLDHLFPQNTTSATTNPQQQPTTQPNQSVAPPSAAASTPVRTTGRNVTPLSTPLPTDEAMKAWTDGANPSAVVTPQQLTPEQMTRKSKAELALAERQQPNAEKPSLPASPPDFGNLVSSATDKSDRVVLGKLQGIYDTQTPDIQNSIGILVDSSKSKRERAEAALYLKNAGIDLEKLAGPKTDSATERLNEYQKNSTTTMR